MRKWRWSAPFTGDQEQMLADIRKVEPTGLDRIMSINWESVMDNRVRHNGYMIEKEWRELYECKWQPI